MKNPKIFITDYASYNEGSQFKFGHWINLKDYSDADELMEYIKNHFAEADEKSPLESGGQREELMITDFEDLPKNLYSESMGYEDFNKIYRLMDWMEENGMESLENEGDNLLYLWNDYVREHNSGDNEIFNFDDETLEMLFGSDSMKAFMAGVNAQINWSDDYLTLDGYGNIESLDDPSYHIDETVLIDYILENLI